jgi:hypothetical protein
VTGFESPAIFVAAARRCTRCRGFQILGEHLLNVDEDIYDEAILAWKLLRSQEHLESVRALVSRPVRDVGATRVWTTAEPSTSHGTSAAGQRAGRPA